MVSVLRHLGPACRRSADDRDQRDNRDRQSLNKDSPHGVNFSFAGNSTGDLWTRGGSAALKEKVETIAASRKISVDDGWTFVAIDVTTSQLLTGSGTGTVAGANGREICRTGSDDVEYAGTLGIFAAMVTIRDGLLTADASLVDSFSRRLDDSERILETVGEQSATLKAQQVRTQELQLESRVAPGGLDVVDMITAVFEQQNEQSLLDYTHASLVRILDRNLLDFLR